MLKISIGNKIKSLSKKTTHVVESIEIFENQTVVFTEDVKCFPIEDVQKRTTDTPSKRRSGLSWLKVTWLCVSRQFVH